MGNILSVLKRPEFDTSIINKEYHSYLPYLQSFDNNDEIRIAIQNPDLYVLPSESYLYIEGFSQRESDHTVSPNIRLLNNCVAYLFEEIRYELNGVEIDNTRKLGINRYEKPCIIK